MRLAPLASCLLPLVASAQLQDIVYQSPQEGTPDYLILNIGFSEDACGLAAAVSVETDDLEDIVAPNLAAELAKISHGKLTPVFTTLEVTVPNSREFYRKFSVEVDCVVMTTNETRSVVELRQAARAQASLQLTSPGIDEFARIIYVADKFAWTTGNGGMGTINQRAVFVDLLALSVPVEEWHLNLAHELGHSYGWEHADLWAEDCENLCPNPPVPYFAGTVGYGDEFDPMGDRFPGLPSRSSHWFHPWFMLRAGWIEEDAIEDSVVVDVPYALRPLDQPYVTPPDHKVALKIPLDDNTNAWVFWRAYEPENNPVTSAPMNVNDGPVIALESESTISRTLLFDAHPGGCPGSVDDAAMDSNQTLTVHVPGTDPAGPAAFDIRYLGIEGGAVIVSFTRLPNGVDENPVIGRVHAEPPSGSIPVTGDIFTYSFTAHRPGAGPNNGDGLATVRMRLFEWIEDVRPAAFGLIGCAPPGGPSFPAPRLPDSPTTSRCCPSLGPLNTPMALATEFLWTNDTQAPTTFDWTIDTGDVVGNGRYVVYVEATGTNGTRTVDYWPHVIYNP